MANPRRERIYARDTACHNPVRPCAVVQEGGNPQRVVGGDVRQTECPQRGGAGAVPKLRQGVDNHRLPEQPQRGRWRSRHRDRSVHPNVARLAERDLLRRHRLVEISLPLHHTPAPPINPNCPPAAMIPFTSPSDFTRSPALWPDAGSPTVTLVAAIVLSAAWKVPFTS